MDPITNPCFLEATSNIRGGRDFTLRQFVNKFLCVNEYKDRHTVFMEVLV